jgi:hypothetical protein
MIGAITVRTAGSGGTRSATYSSRNAYQFHRMSGSSELVCTPFVSVILMSRRFGTRWSIDAKSPPVCSSCQAPARNIGTSMSRTQLMGERWSMSDGV